MNNWVYLILIAVLAILAVVMLYSRFAARSREKSFHHSPARIVFSAESISVAPLDEHGAAAIPIAGEDVFSLPQIKPEPVEEPAPENLRAERAKNPESDYLDELQEAAAGLALLMRSSPVGRVAPVIFAPDGSKNPVVLEAPVEAVDEAVLGEPVNLDEMFVPASEGPGLASDPAEERIVPVREVLGEFVLEIVDRIDLELEALESLVVGIEMSLLALNGPGNFEEGKTSDGEEANQVYEAA